MGTDNCVPFSQTNYTDIRHDFAEGAKETEVVGFGFSKVLESKNPDFHVGSSYYFSFLPWSSYSVLRPKDLGETFNIDSIDKDIPLSAYSGILGASGLTVWDSFNRVADLKKGETIYISNAAG